MAEQASEIKARFEAEGISIKEWSQNNGFNPRTVYAVIWGDIKAKRGIGHRIAVALGIKKLPLHADNTTRIS
ncbi:DNA-binding protein [Methylobacterium platani]|uniref:DNA-binding protein n=1 Tax=Methylobacterium platani TaxID=427683 RepID=UPI0009E4A17C|nr:DNA-binding protein [Methylobacterium platani]